MRFLAIAVLVSLSIGSCKKLDVPKGTPKCIKKEIKKQIKNKTCLEFVYEYQYKGETVYFFQDGLGCSNTCGYLLDNNCAPLQDGNSNTICDCMVGIAINCDDFFQNKTDEKLIWQREL